MHSVSELGSLLDRELERSFPDVWVEGEVSNFSASQAGHLYFRLKDGSAVIKAAMFRQSALRLSFRIENGMALLVRGRLGFYGSSGELQLYVTHAEPYGAGAMQMALEQAKKRLQSEGLADPSRKRRIPRYPRTVGVVTSIEGAAVRDIVSILERRRVPFGIVVSPSAVQGEQAPAQLMSSMRRLFNAGGIDLIIITRGGGSFEDLNAFNDESLARLVAASPVPVISAVGHEVDTVLTDLTADLRAPTPSAAAEIVSQPFVEAGAGISSAARAILSGVSARLELAGEKLSAFDPGREGTAFLRDLDRMEESRDRSVSLLSERMCGRFDRDASRAAVLSGALHPSKLVSALSVCGARLSSARKDLSQCAARAAELRERSLAGALSLLEAKNPLSILSRGYSVVKDGKGAVVADSSSVEVGEQLSVLLNRGGLKVSVDQKD